LISGFKIIIKTASCILILFLIIICAQRFYFWVLKFKNFSTAPETLRGVSFDFKYNTAFYNQHFYIDPNWLQWFIGFAEGDGGIFTDKNDYISFVITQNESKILYHIKDN